MVSVSRNPARLPSLREPCSSLLLAVRMERGHAGLLVLSALLVLSSPHVTCQQSAGDPCSLRSDGSRGVCRLISDCPSAEEVRMRGRPPTCGFSGFMPIVCCGTQSNFNSFNSAPNSFNTAPNSFNTAPNSFNTAPNSFNTAPNSGSSNSNRRRENGAVSKRMCEQYSRAVTHTLSALPLLPDPEPIPVLVPNCSLYQTPLIVGGEEARPGEFPHMVAVGYPLENQQLQWACGGTLISDRYVVTAAHCSYNKFANSPPTVARLGAHSLTQREEALWTDVPISGVEMHPDYKVSSRYNDIALLRLQRTVTFTSSIRPACLWTEERLPYKNATATGWGRIGSGEETSDVLMKTQLELVETPACRRRLQPSRRFEEGVIATQLCAGGGANDTCQGDSGGPLVVSSQDNWCVFYLVGVTSFGARCGAPIPAVYTRVSAFLPWLEGLVWPGN